MASRTPDKETVSELTTARLSVYLRSLTYLASIGKKTVSSHELAERFHLNSSQIRKDLACFGEFGTRGVGYDVCKLKAELVRELGIDRTRNIVIAGAGNLGMALADYRGFNSNGFHIIALLDNDAEKIGRTSRSGIPVIDAARIEKVVRENNVEIGIIAVNPDAAQPVYDVLVRA
ncbi:MAG TPA: redox-sensing transcriptional repressor Rex, partial [Thermoanaerobaculia bacterium]